LNIPTKKAVCGIHQVGVDFDWACRLKTRIHKVGSMGLVNAKPQTTPKDKEFSF
jgi:hypothetical protein